GEAVLIAARDAVVLGDVLRGLAHRIDAVPLAHLRIHESPANAGVEHLDVARPWLARLRHHERRARHALDAPRDVHLPFTDLDGARGAGDGAHAGRAQSVYRLTGDGVRQPREQRGHARDVAVVLARLIRAAEHDVRDR